MKENGTIESSNAVSVSYSNVISESTRRSMLILKVALVHIVAYDKVTL